MCVCVCVCPSPLPHPAGSSPRIVTPEANLVLFVLIFSPFFSPISRNQPFPIRATPRREVATELAEPRFALTSY